MQGVFVLRIDLSLRETNLHSLSRKQRTTLHYIKKKDRDPPPGYRYEGTLTLPRVQKTLYPTKEHRGTKTRLDPHN